MKFSLFAKFLPKLSEISRPLVAIAFTVWGCYLRFKMFATRDFWVDETNQFVHTVGAFQPFWKRLTYGEVTCFPGEYLLNYPFVQFFGDNKWGISIPHMVAMFLGFYLLYIICRLYFKTIWGYVITFAIFANNSNLVYHALEFRPYAVLPTLSLAAFYLSHRIVFHYPELSRLKKFLIGLFFTLSIMYHAYGIMIVFFCMLFHFIVYARQTTFKETLLRILPFSISLAAVSLPIFLWYATGETGMSYENNSIGRNINTFDFIPNPLVSLNVFLRTVMGNLAGYKKLKWLVNGILLCFLIPHKERWQKVGFLLILIILPIELICVADARTGYWFLQRQFIWVMPYYAFLLGWCWDTIAQFIFSKTASLLGRFRQ